MSDNRPVFPDPRDLPHSALLNVCDLSSQMADRYREHSLESGLVEDVYIAAVWASIAGWLDLAPLEIAYDDDA